MLPSKGVSILNGRFRLYVSQNGLEAYLKSENGDQILSSEDYQELQEELKKLGIVHGILKFPEYSHKVMIVARGTPPTPGEDGRIEILVDLKRGPKQEDKGVDLRELNSIVCVKAGQPVAEKILLSPGKPGVNVYGEPIPPPPSKEAVFKYGKGLQVSENGSLLLATTDGVLVNKAGRLEVLPVYKLEADIDWDIGNIHFYGKKLVIKGDIRPGFTVETQGDLEIRGRVENGVTLRVHGNLNILGPVQGENTVIKCKGNAYLSIVEYAKLIIGGDLIIKDYILHAQCIVGGNLKATEGVGKIVGGEYHVRESVVAQILGSSAYVPTIIKAGYDELLQERLEEIYIELAILEEMVIRLHKILDTGLRLYKEGKLNQEKLSILKKVKIKYEETKQYIRELEEQKAYIFQLEENSKKATVHVLKEVFPGVEIWIADDNFSVVSHFDKGVFFDRKNQILFRPSA